MYAFLVAVTIFLPSMKPTKNPQPPQKYVIRVYDGDQSDKDNCIKRAEKVSEYIATKVKMIVQTEITCTLIDTRKI